MKFKLFISFGLLLVLLYVVSKAIDMQKIQQIILSFPKDKLAILFTLSLLITSLKSLRFYILLQNSKIPISLFNSWRTTIAGGALTPLPGGEAIRGILLKKDVKVDTIQSSGPII